MNGTGRTDRINGRGNLILGYDLPRDDETYVCSDGQFLGQEPCERVGQTWAVSHKTGSHYLVIGDKINYSQYGGLVVGFYNTSNAPSASVSGGMSNTARAPAASVSGGRNNKATGLYSSVSGGHGNMAIGADTSISGGGWNVAMTDENGFYHFDQLPAGTWTGRAVKWGYEVGTAEVVIVENTTTVQDFALTPR